MSTETNYDALQRGTITGTALPVRGDDIDTDRIIPARYLKCVTFEELGAYAFYDERFDESGGQKKHPFNEERFAGAAVLIVNKNFGCGSSREHAPQSLMRMGIGAIVGESFAEIFAGNCTALGIPTVWTEHDSIVTLLERVEAEPTTKFVVDLAEKTIRFGDDSLPIDMPESYRSSLIAGSWDTAAELLINIEMIGKVREQLPYIKGY